MANTEKNDFVFLPLGGVGEIGMNFALYGFGPPKNREWIVVDCGVTFPGPDLPGVDLVLPDIRFIEERKDRLRGIVITHAHEDHYGALLALWPRLKVPVWMSPFGAGMLESKREGERGAPQVPVTIYKAGDRFEIGPFAIEAIAVTHSIPESHSLAITTPLGTVIHTGDWKDDDAPSLGPVIDEGRFRALGDKGVLALVCDSTNAMREGVSPTERAVSESLSTLISQARGRVAITTFSSNVGRIRSIAQAAHAAGRKTLLLGRSMKRVVEVAEELGYMEGLPDFVAEEDFEYIPREELVIILTGSQGESRAALAKLSRDEMRTISLTAGDTVIYSSRPIPGNEKPILDTITRLIDRGVNIITDSQALVHVSGHPRRNELQKMYQWLRPQVGVPVHGEAAHLTAQAALMREAGIPEVAHVRNGDMLRFAPGPAEVIEDAPHGRLVKDGEIIGTTEETGVDERRRLSFAGHVTVNIIVNKDMEIIGDPDVVAYGLPKLDVRGEEIEDMLFDAAVEAYESVPKARRKDLDKMEESVSRAVRAAARDAWGKKPVTLVFVTKV